jgi:hypothetical protein
MKKIMFLALPYGMAKNQVFAAIFICGMTMVS